MMEPFSQSMEIQGFRYDFDKVKFSLSFYKPRMKKPIITNAEKNSIQFQFQFRFQNKYKYNVFSLDNGQLITAQENKTPIRTGKSFLANPRLFKYGWELPGYVSNMLTEVGVDRVGATEYTKNHFIQKVFDEAFDIVNKGGLMLSLGIHITCAAVYKRTQQHEELVQERLRQQQQVVQEQLRYQQRLQQLVQEQLRYQQRLQQQQQLDVYITERIMMRSTIEASERLKMIPASRKAIDELEKIIFDGGGETSIINKVCNICLDEFEMGLEVTRLPCSHGFHGDCIIKWLETSHFCPLCRFTMPINDDSL